MNEDFTVFHQLTNLAV